MVPPRRKFVLCCLAVAVVIGLLFLSGIFSSDPEGKKTSNEGPGSGSMEDTGSTSAAAGSAGVRELVQHCIATAHLDSVLESNFSVKQAMANAKYFFDEFRKLIPEKSLDGYKSHCWAESYFTKWTKNQYSGYVGNISFSKKIGRQSKRAFLLPALSKSVPARRYKSKLVCLPNVFLAGFPKCGSTFLYCFINKLVSSDTKLTRMNTEKEPHFWALANAAKNTYIPLVDSIGSYLLNFLPGLKQIQDFRRPEGILIDSSPNTMFNWPRFRNVEDDLTNYCILPSVLPKLLPNSKFVVIMRKPVNMLYSAFWFSCTTTGKKFSAETLLKAPDIFHERVMSKISMFNKCMRDVSVPSISYVCELSRRDYNTCIRKRLHLLEKCSHKITFNLFSTELSGCGRSRVAMGLYYVHVKKWLSVVSRDRLLFLTLQGLAEHPVENARMIQGFLGLKPNGAVVKHSVDSCNENTQSSVYRHNPKLQMRNDTRLLLERFYYPFNSLLADLTENKELLWRSR